MRFRAFQVDWDSLFFRKFFWALSAKRERAKRARCMREHAAPDCDTCDSDLLVCNSTSPLRRWYLEWGQTKRKNSYIDTLSTVVPNPSRWTVTCVPIRCICVLSTCTSIFTWFYGANIWNKYPYISKLQYQRWKRFQL